MYNYSNMKNIITKFPNHIVGLLFAAYPFLCKTGESVGIFALLCVSAVCVVWAVMVNKTFRITVADAMAALVVLWIIAAYFIAKQDIIAPDRIYEFAGLCLIWFAVRNSRNPWWIVLYILAGALLQVVLCGAQMVGIAASGRTFFSFTGSFINTGPLAGLLAITLFAYPYLWGRRGKIWLGIGFVATVAAIIWTGSRASWLAACAVALICVLPWILSRYRKLDARKRIIAGCALALLIAVSCAGLYLLRPSSADGRLLIWKSSVSLFAESPLLGNGPGSFQCEYMYHQGCYLEDKLMSDEATLADSVVYAFSEPIRVLCEYGVVGFLIIGAFIVVVIAGAWKKPSLRFILAGFAAWLVFGLFSYPGSVLPLRLLFVILAALLAQGGHTFRVIELKMPVRIVVVVCIVVLFAASTVNYAHYRRLGKVMHELSHGDKDVEMTGALQKRLDTDPRHLYPYCARLLRDKKYEQAVPVIEQAVRIAPSVLLMSDLGKSYHNVGRIDEAEAYLQTSVNMAPGFVTPVYELFNFYRREGRTAEALRWAEYIITRKFKAISSVTLFARKEAREFLDANKQE